MDTKELNEETDEERPSLDCGEVVASENGDQAYRVEDIIGEGRYMHVCVLIV